MTKLEKILYTARAHTTGGRDDGTSRTDDGRLQVTLSRPGTPGNGTNPEQLFAAGYAACFGSAIMAVAGQNKLKPDDVAVTGEVTLVVNGHDYSIAVKLKASIGGVSREEAEKLLHAAHQVCPYSKATRGNIPVELELL